MKYQTINKNCPICGASFATKQGHRKEKTCCSRECGNIFFSRKKTDKEKILIREKTLEYYSSIPKKEMKYEFICRHCGAEFRSRAKRRICCSKKCLFADKQYRKQKSEIQSSKILSGKHPGWKSRAGKPPSYAEKFFMEVLRNNSIDYERDLPAGRWFIDFAMKDKMIALEIDGKQHDWPCRKIKDEEKDEFLMRCGWRVHRIKWKSINSKNGKSYIEAEINKFLEIYRSQVFR